MASPDIEEFAKLLLPRYRVLRLFSQGWSSWLLKATFDDRYERSSVVVKVLKKQIPEQDPVRSRPYLLEAFSREAIALATCEHQSVPKFIDYLWLGEDPCIVMEECSGRTVQEILSDLGLLPWVCVQRIAMRILDVLGVIHSKGWLYCDVNPNNIIVGKDEIYLIDFGAAQIMGRPPLWEWPLGRHRYMAPEQLLGAWHKPMYKELNLASDLHQVGCLISYLLTKKQAFRDPLETETYGTDYLYRLGKWMASPVETKMQILAVESARTDVPRGLDAVLECALQPDPRERYSSALQMRAAIERLNA